MLTSILGEADPVAIEGRWRNSTGTVIVAIRRCGDAMCGSVDWASEQAQADSRRAGNDPLIGVEVLSRFELKGQGRWRGKLFVPDANRRAKAELRLLEADQLKVTGCAVGRLICKSEIWTRAVGQ